MKTDERSLGSQVVRPALLSLLVLTLLTGAAYPLLITGVAQLLFPAQANGSLLVRADGTVAGSALIGQEFGAPGYFWARPSATGPAPYNAAASSGSNFGPLNTALVGPEGTVQARIDALRAAAAAVGVQADGPIPVDLVTASGSGLDPHISPAAAHYQVARVAAARHLSVDEVLILVVEFTEGRTFGLLGEPRVNVLRLNLALDERFPFTADKLDLLRFDAGPPYVEARLVRVTASIFLTRS